MATVVAIDAMPAVKIFENFVVHCPRGVSSAKNL
jgi:hypothetical protein